MLGGTSCGFAERGLHGPVNPGNRTEVQSLVVGLYVADPQGVMNYRSRCGRPGDHPGAMFWPHRSPPSPGTIVKDAFLAVQSTIKNEYLVLALREETAV